ncbi:DUF475 domain-containing protein [Paraburkholderia sp. UCT31]|uniref:DUF475 domain-containing protein n=1 Tax=Paraburkholderia sp. UCT31 TaxID=2615209 RepID=UPI0016553734|nr:DUF475 domain-containing protein [Paraburkholderia sp. UCT31]MBC8741822.1 DUF475 domain-containing protein [Paraburkholderia sp. UCT31]
MPSVKNTVSDFRWPAILTVLGLIAGGWLNGVQGFLVVATLAPLEISVSFDNAVLNAAVLRNWNSAWRAVFMRVGLPIAVIGMRLLFPLAIVAVLGHVSLVDAAKMAVLDPKQYANVLQSSHREIAAFGGAFLLMVFWEFMLNVEKDSHWLRFIEQPLSKAGKIGKLDVFLTLGILAITTMFVADEERLSFVFAGISGVMSFVAAHGLGSALQGDDEEAAEGSGGEVAKAFVKQGLLGLLYLETLDASCSFDGVIGALAISDNIFLIAIGLGIGAAYVRKLTLLLVENDSLQAYRYLEHGAFWAIGALGALMFVGVVHEVPEVVTGLLGVASIACAVWSSLRANKAEQRAAVAAQ